MLSIQRIYSIRQNPPSGYRILVDRLWPRGISKAQAQLDDWAKTIAPSPELRKWFAHDPSKFEEFRSRYLQELTENPDTPAFIDQVQTQLAQGDVTLLYAAKDEEHNQAVVLLAYLQEKVA
ncbi:hypothetical protein LFYK43_09040 [Ligilactobacillus salitolerans]|uniref:MarR family transcriptional regulator n=1 Tax=Ligilactobacillus salitolerans TaxID=1808352 RepID=A0A401ISH7_9LACO|nr:DUF488 domain-containing protein [Ligilactobacillus salitolerans]GBG94445.1 hypothetical protein LFYK43_09040 [Ligilactobacillus salitolerans]